MPRQTFVLNKFLGINNVKDSRDIADHELTKTANLMFDKQGAMRTAGQFTEYLTTNFSGDSSSNSAGNGLFYIESDRSLETPISEVIDDYHGGSACCKFYSSGTASGLPSLRHGTVDVYNAFDVGDKIRIEGSDQQGTNGIRTILEKWSYGFTGIQKYDLGLSGIADWGGGTVDSGDDVTITKYHNTGDRIWVKPKSATSSTAANLQARIFSENEEDWADYSIQPIAEDEGVIGDFKPRYYFADLALRVSDSNYLNGSRVKWFGFIERNHFGNEPYLDWITKNNDLAPPAESQLSASYPATAQRIYWRIVNSTPGATDPESEWVDADYECAMSFIYDDIQESKLYDMADSGGTSVFNVPAGDIVTISAKCLSPFNARISGARLYCRGKGSDDDWSFLAELDLSKGIKTTLSGDFISGFSVGGANEYTSEASASLRQNLDTYQSINGFSPDLDTITLGSVGDSWGTSCVANRRVFIANLNIYDGQINGPRRYGDRIMYSEIGKYDTFPSHNYIDVVKGDAEEYIALLEYGDRLMAFKHNTLFILNIANPSPTAWFLEKTFKYKGIKHPEAAFRTEDGVVWVNDAGCWIYNGEQIINLIDNKIDTVQSYTGSDEHQYSWKDFYTEDSIVGYSPKYKQILVLRNSAGTSINAVFLYDIKTQSWAYIRDASTFFGNVVYSNFILDGDGELAIMTTGGDIKYYDPVSVACNAEFITKFIDLGSPNNIKKIYKVAITYKSEVTQAEPLTCRYIDKAGTMVNSAFSVDQFDPVTLAVKADWEIAVFTPVSSLTCQSIQFKMRFPSSGTIDINEIMVYYRTKKRVVKN